MKQLLLLLVLPLFLLSCNSQSEKEDVKNVRPVNLGFYETYHPYDIQPLFSEVDSWLKNNDSLLKTRHIKIASFSDLISTVPGNQSVIGLVKQEHLDAVKAILELKEIQALFPEDLKFTFSAKKSKTYRNSDAYELFALKIPKNGKAELNGKHVKEASYYTNSSTGQIVIVFSMTDAGYELWYEMTSRNIGKAIAITADDAVLACPNVNQTIDGAPTEITADFTVEEAKELSAGINAGRK